jgi:putative ABC transport system permease protein
MLAVSLLCTILFAKSALQQETTEQTSKRVTAGYVLRSRDTPGLPPAIAATVRQLPGVAGASGSIATSVVVAADQTDLQSFAARGVDAATLRRVVDLDVRSGSLTALAGSSVAVGSNTARALGWQTGDEVKLWLGDGTPATLRVAAIYARPLGYGEFVLPRTLVENHVTHPLDDAVFVRATSTTDQTELLGRLRKLAHAQPSMQVITRSQYQHQLEADAHTKSLEVYVLLAVIGVFCALALINAVTMATAERAREFALLRLVGASKRQVRTMIRAETLIMLAYGLSIGSLIAAPGLAAFNYSLTGSAIPPVSLPIYGGLLVAFALLGFTATVLPTRVALQLDPIKALAARE